MARNALALACAAILLALFLRYHGAEIGIAPARAWLALGLTLVFSLAAWFARGVSVSGAVTGGALSLIMASRELGMFWLLLIMFVVTLAATRAGSRRKQALQVAEPESGRSASQVMANLGIAGLMLALPGFEAWRLLAIAALAEAAADTTSSEIGAAVHGKTVLITSWKAVAPGTDGGISAQGTLAAAVAAFIIAGSATALGMIPVRQALIAAGAGTGGMLVDSLLGAALEQRGWLNNDLVNLLGTAGAVGLAMLLA